MWGIEGARRCGSGSAQSSAQPLALAVDLFAAMMALGDRPDGWDKTIVIVIIGGPIAVVVGAILGGIVRWRRSASNTEPSLTARSPATWRSHHPISWIAGAIASVVVGLGLVPIVWALMILVVYVGKRFPLTYPIASFLVAPAVLYCMVLVGRAVMRLVERRIRRGSGAETSEVWVPD
jgi:hypothetical protein